MKILLVLLLFIIQGGSVSATEAINVRLSLDKGFYRPEETVRVTVVAAGSAVNARITHLADTVTEILGQPLVDGETVIAWTPPADAPKGYGITVEILDVTNEVIASAATAFDVLNHWTDAPRYGFLSDFTHGRDNYEETRDWMLRHHITGVQFYDWQYRWEKLMPETDVFKDGMGRELSMVTVRKLIDTIRPHNIAAMPYTAVYGVSAPYLNEHPDWGLYDANGNINHLGEDLIVIFDPTPGSPWNKHLLNEFADVLDRTDFDGIHIDQYGAPKNGFDANGNYVDLAEVFPQFIQQAQAVVKEKRGDEGAVFFNLVGNWPVETVAPVNPDATYIEVWGPYDDYADLQRIIETAQQLGNVPVIIAAYIPPESVTNWRLSNAVIFASGAYHLETGEPYGMLQHAYFPNFGPIPEADRDHYTRYYDFLVRYENVLALAEQAQRADAVKVSGARTWGISALNRVLPITRSGADFETFSLVNFKGIDFPTWNALTSRPPTPMENVDVEITVSRSVRRVWAASPDSTETMDAAQLPFKIENGTLHVTLPSIAYWTMIVVEYDEH